MHKETGILMTQANSQATIEGRKTMTRRLITPQPKSTWTEIMPVVETGWNTSLFNFYNPNDFDDGDDRRCPYGQVGDLLYLKEAHYRYGYWLHDGLTKTGKQKWRFHPATTDHSETNFAYETNPTMVIRPDNFRMIGWYKRSPLFMSKKYARYWYKITGIKAERVQDISWADLCAEGWLASFDEAERVLPFGSLNEQWEAYHLWFPKLWDSINAKRGHSWEKNDWVWVMSYYKEEM